MLCDCCDDIAINIAINVQCTYFLVHHGTLVFFLYGVLLLTLHQVFSSLQSGWQRIRFSQWV